MCRNLKPITDEQVSIVDGEVAGYKVVVVNKSGKYVSPATGYVYGKLGEKHKMGGMPHLICPNYGFADDILDDSSLVYEENMAGKTGIFLNYQNAYDLYSYIRLYIRNHYRPVDVCLMDAKVSGELAIGRMIGYGDVVVGTHITLEGKV